MKGSTSAGLALVIGYGKVFFANLEQNLQKLLKINKVQLLEDAVNKNGIMESLNDELKEIAVKKQLNTIYINSINQKSVTKLINNFKNINYYVNEQN